MERWTHSFLLIFLSLLCINIQGQDSTATGNFSPQFTPCESPLLWDKEYYVTFWISADESGDTDGFNLAQCQAMIDEVNAVFQSEVNARFKIFKVSPMLNFQFEEVQTPEEQVQMTSMYHHVGSINIHVVEEILGPPPMAFSGYSLLPPNPRDVIVIPKAQFQPGNKRIFHLLGHFFGLLDTHDTSNGAELVNGSNCDTSGDLLCDTNADISSGQATGNSCNYNGPVFQDLNGDNYYPPVDNFMSEYTSFCKCRYSIMQYQRMAAFDAAFRTQLW